MRSENTMVEDLDDVVCVFWILLLKMLQYLELDSCLVLVSLLILDNLDGNVTAFNLILGFDYLSKRTFTDQGINFISKRKDHVKRENTFCSFNNLTCPQTFRPV